MNWIKTSDRIPVMSRDDVNWPHVYCLVYLKGYGVIVRPYNVYHDCWDDEESDDHFKDTMDIPYWMPQPECPRESE